MLLRQTQLYLPAQIGAPLVQLASVLLWAHLLPGEELGKLMLVVALQDILFSLVFVWWTHFMLRHRPRLVLAGGDFQQTERVVVGTLLVAQAMIASLIGVLYFSASQWLFHVAVCVFVSLKAVSVYGGERMRAEGRIFAYSLVQVVLPACGLVLSVASLSFFEPNAETVLFSAVLPLAFVFLCFSSSGGEAGVKGVNRRTVRDALAFGFPSSVASLMSAVAFNLPRFAVAFWLGQASAGVFSVVFGLGVRISTFAVMLVTAGAYPLAVRSFEQEGEAAGLRQLSMNMVLVYAVAVPMAFGLASISGSFANLLLPSSMQHAALVILPFAALAGLFRYLRSHTTDQVFLLASATRPIAIIAVIELCLTAIFSLAGLGLFGMAGCAAGVCLATFVATILSLIWSKSVFRFKMPLSPISRIVAAATLMAAAIHIWAALLICLV